MSSRYASSMPPGGGQPPYRPTIPRPSGASTGSSRRPPGAPSATPWKAQRYACKAGYWRRLWAARSFVVGPIILVGIGVVALLMVTGHIAADDFWTWYAHWWPLLLIGAGLALLGEWALDMRSANAGPPRRQLCRHPHSAGHHRPWRRRMEQLVGPVPRPVRRPGQRRLLQCLRPARSTTTTSRC